MVLNVVRLDLHGFTVQEAKGTLKRDIPLAYNTGKDAILIICGKGSGVLRRGVLSFFNGSWTKQYVNNIIPGEREDLPGGEGVIKIVFKVKHKRISGKKIKPKSKTELINEYKSAGRNDWKAKVAAKKKKGREKYLKRMKRFKKR